MGIWKLDRHQALKVLELTGIIITLILLPIDRLPYLHRIPFNLGLISACILMAAAAIRLLGVVLQKRYADFRRYFLIGILLVLPVLGYALSSLWAIDRPFARGATTLLAAVTVRAFCFFVLVSETPTYWQIIKKVIYGVTAVVVAFGFFQFFFDVWGAPPNITDLRVCCTSNSTYIFPRVHSVALEPLYLDHFLMIPIWLLTFDFLRSQASRKNRWLRTLFTGTAILFILTIARSATIGLIIAAILFYFGIRHQKDIRQFFRFIAKVWGIAVLVSILLVLMSGVGAIFIDKQAQYKSRGAASLGLFGGHIIDVTDGSAQTRYKLWPKVFPFFAEQPLHGVGADNSRIRLDLRDYKRGVSPAKLQPFNNDLIGLVVDLGLLALVTFGPMIIALLIALWRLHKSNWKAVSAPLALALIGMIIQGSFFQSLLLTRLWIVVGLVLLVFSPTKNSHKYFKV